MLNQGILVPRDPTSVERELYLEAVQNRDEERYLFWLDWCPRVLWGTVYNALSAEDRAWVDGVMARKEEKKTFQEAEENWESF